MLLKELNDVIITSPALRVRQEGTCGVVTANVHVTFFAFFQYPVTTEGLVRCVSV